MNPIPLTKFLPESEWTQPYTPMDVDEPLLREPPKKNLLKRRLVPEPAAISYSNEPWTKPSGLRHN